MRTNEDNDQPISHGQLTKLEMYIDQVFNRIGIDVSFTKHFLDRLNDERNGKQISIQELGRLFAKEYKRWGKPIAQMGPDKEAVMKDLESDINVPFVLNWDRSNNTLDLVAKTVMRKKNFKTPDKEFPVEGVSNILKKARKSPNFGIDMGQVAEDLIGSSDNAYIAHTHDDTSETDLASLIVLGVLSNRKVDDLKSMAATPGGAARIKLMADKAHASLNLGEAISKDEMISNLKQKAQHKYVDAAIEALNRLVSSDPRGQDIQGYAFDIARAFGNQINSRQLAKLYMDKYGDPLRGATGKKLEGRSATDRKTVAEEMPAAKNGLGLTIFDIDETLFKTNSKIAVVKDGQVVKTLDNQEYNTYELQPGEEYDYREFRNAAKFRQESKPIPAMIAKLNAIVKNAGPSKVIMLTARADFDDKETFLQTFRDHGIPIDLIHVHRTGNMPGDDIAGKKVVYIRRYLDSGKYKRVRMYDDGMKNLKAFLALQKEYTDIKFSAFFVTHNGSTQTIKEAQGDEDDDSQKIRIINVNKEWMSSAWGQKLIDGTNLIGAVGEYTLNLLPHHSVHNKKSYDEAEVFVTNKVNLVVGRLVISRSEGVKNASKRPYKVAGAALAPEIQGKGLMPKIYAEMIRNGFFLQADYHQSKGGASIWTKLSKEPGVTVYGARPVGKKWEYTAVEGDDLLTGDFHLYHQEEGEEIAAARNEWKAAQQIANRIRIEISDTKDQETKSKLAVDLNGILAQADKLQAEYEKINKTGDDNYSKPSFLLAVAEKTTSNATESTQGASMKLSELQIEKPETHQTLGIERKDMPQIKKKDLPEFFKYMEDKGVTVTKETVAAASLKATQKNFDDEKIIQSMDTAKTDKPIIISMDDYVIDGHHRWLGAVNTGSKINVVRVDLPVKKLLRLALAFPKTYFKDVHESAGVGKIVPGVNTTVDVGPNEITKQAAKFGNKVSTDGVPKKKLGESRSFQSNVSPVGKLVQEYGFFATLGTMTLKQDANSAESAQKLSDLMQRLGNDSKVLSAAGSAKIDSNKEKILRHIYDMMQHAIPLLKSSLKPEAFATRRGQINAVLTAYNAAAGQNESVQAKFRKSMLESIEKEFAAFESAHGGVQLDEDVMGAVKKYSGFNATNNAIKTVKRKINTAKDAAALIQDLTADEQSLAASYKLLRAATVLAMKDLQKIAIQITKLRNLEPDELENVKNRMVSMIAETNNFLKGKTRADFLKSLTMYSSLKYLLSKAANINTFVKSIRDGNWMQTVKTIVKQFGTLAADVLITGFLSVVVGMGDIAVIIFETLVWLKNELNGLVRHG